MEIGIASSPALDMDAWLQEEAEAMGSAAVGRAAGAAAGPAAGPAANADVTKPLIRGTISVQSVFQGT